MKNPSLFILIGLFIAIASTPFAFAHPLPSLQIIEEVDSVWVEDPLIVEQDTAAVDDSDSGWVNYKDKLESECGEKFPHGVYLYKELKKSMKENDSYMKTAGLLLNTMKLINDEQVNVDHEMDALSQYIMCLPNFTQDDLKKHSRELLTAEGCRGILIAKGALKRNDYDQVLVKWFNLWADMSTYLLNHSYAGPDYSNKQLEAEQEMMEWLEEGNYIIFNDLQPSEGEKYKAKVGALPSYNAIFEMPVVAYYDEEGFDYYNIWKEKQWNDLKKAFYDYISARRDFQNSLPVKERAIVERQTEEFEKYLLNEILDMKRSHNPNIK